MVALLGSYLVSSFFFLLFFFGECYMDDDWEVFDRSFQLRRIRYYAWFQAQEAEDAEVSIADGIQEGCPEEASPE